MSNLEEIKNIYSLLLRSNGLKIKDIANALNLDKFHVAEIMFSLDCIDYWSQDSSSMWYAKEGALEIEKPSVEDEILNNLPEIKEFDISRYLASGNSKSHSLYLKSIINYPHLSDAEMRELLKSYRKGNKWILETIVKANQRIIVYIAHSYIHRGASFEDLVQEGNIGLLKAVEKFRFNAHCTFEQYAKAWILQQITYASQHIPYLVHYPLNIQYLHSKVQRQVNKFIQNNGYQPSCADIEIDDFSFDNIVNIFRLPDNLRISVEYLGSSSDELYGDMMTDEVLMCESKRSYVNALLNNLKPRQREILVRAFGLGGRREETLSVIGDSIDLTRERVRQIRERAIEKIQIRLGLKEGKDDNSDESESQLPPAVIRAQAKINEPSEELKAKVQELIREQSNNDVGTRTTTRYLEIPASNRPLHRRRLFYDDPDRPTRDLRLPNDVPVIPKRPNRFAYDDPDDLS